MAFPSNFDFQLAATPDHVPTGGKWVYELKYDGERALIQTDKSGKPIQVWSRRKSEKSATYPELLLPELKGLENSLLDVEICVFNEKGVSDFDLLALRSHLKDRTEIFRRAQRYPVQAVILDVPVFHGESIMSLPYRSRRGILSEGAQTCTKYYSISDQFQTYEQGWAQVMESGEEGLIAKRLESAYWAGKRHPDWAKIKAWKELTASVRSWDLNPAGATLNVIDEYGVEHRVQCADRAALRRITAQNGSRVVVQYLSRTEAQKLRFPSFRGLADVPAQRDWFGASAEKVEV